MTEPPRPPGDDPTAAGNPYPADEPAPGSTPPPYSPPPGPPPSAGGPAADPGRTGGYPPPTAGGAYGTPPPGASYGAPPPGASYGGPPPAGGPYGAPQYGYGAGPGGFASDEDRTWVMVSHFGGAALAFVSTGWIGWLAPLVALLVRGGQSPAVRAHAVKALNFQLLWAVVALAITIISTCLTIIVIGFVGYFLLAVPWFMGTLFGILAGVRALNGEPYNYPAAPTWVK